MEKKVFVRDVLHTLDKITGGRVVKSAEDYACGKNPFVVTKTSNIPGKAVTELPGLIWGNPDQEVKKIAVLMTLTESGIELAGATGVDAIVAHHTIADAANSGGVLLKTYLSLYNIALFELHEAFHGLHPGISYLHGHKAYHVDIKYGGIPGNIMYVGEALPEVKTVGDMLTRLDKLMNTEFEEQFLAKEREIRGCDAIEETSVKARGKILVGKGDNPVHKIIHIFPHTGFTPEHLEQAVKEHPGADTLLATISRVKPGNALIAKAEELGLNFVCGNSHAMEIMENGLPLARAIKMYLPEVEVVIFRERVTSIPLEAVGSASIQDYAAMIAQDFLVK
ncbi:MAG: Nif3-like dinuclear metal center hexameric protein [Bacillota bacterium]|uniref:GTP cyclohydrolase 1 type 2 homolog n=1 Tax=Thermanaerosceptrum fracticalcis TaxID=1712410 RepID=A0A7G6E4G6_THEFR|nr:Nif3-like dinuclear metal center hexameric protein [Thermanaerosceptrum fracticalcis]QNB46970.1 NGG1p interacting factor NIF3 [Thermanaerosceptrum fracticalcis]